MDLDPIITAVAHNYMWSLIGFVFVVGILASTLRQIVRGRARERTRREIAAYIAEGSMTPEQGERLMKAGNDESCC